MPKPTFIFVLGIEGCGHHALDPVLLKATSAQKSDRDLLRGLFREKWSIVENENVEKLAQIDGAIRILISKLPTKNARFIVEGNSFPSGFERRREHSAQWDLHELHQMLSKRFQMKYIVLYRDPIEATFSHRDWDGGLLGHARTLAGYLSLINTFISTLPGEQFTVLNYNDLLFQHEKVARRLEAFLETPPGLLAREMEKHLDADPARVVRWKRELSEDEQRWISEYFELHRSTWQQLTASENDLCCSG